MSLPACNPCEIHNDAFPATHTHVEDRRVSRREFVVAAAGTLGTVLGAGLWIPGLADGEEMGGSAPKPIPGGFKPPFTERFIHHYIPPMVQSGRDPSQITDFDGFVGVAQITGTGTGTNKKTGAMSQLLFEIDNRFMTGTYIGVDGRQYTRTFGFLWLDLYLGQADPQHQIHDYNPGFTSNNLMWTVPMSADSVKVTDDKTIVWQLRNFATRDYHDVVNALRPGEPGPSVPATVSFRIQWGDVIEVVDRRDTQDRYAAQLIHRKATVEWEADQADFKFKSAPANTSQNKLSLIAVERNGSFFT